MHTIRHIAALSLVCVACGKPGETASSEKAEVGAGGEEASTGAQSAAAMVAELAADIQPHVPLPLDDETRLDGARADGDALVYHITLVNSLPSQFEDTGALEQTLLDTWTNQACSRPDAQPLLSAGGKLRYDVHWKDGTPFTELEVSADDCD